MTFKISSPKVYLFAYSFQPSAETQNDYSKDYRNYLWEECNNITSTILNIEFVNPSFFIKSKENKNYTFCFDILEENCYKVQVKNSKIYLQRDKSSETGILIYHKKIDDKYDNYGLGINLNQRKKYHVNQSLDLNIFGRMNQNNCLIFQRNNENKEYFIGQTIIISAKLGQEDIRKKPEELKNIADKCVENFLGITKPKEFPLFNQFSLLFGSPIFEYEFNDLKNSCHILVLLVKDTEVNRKLDNCYEQLFDLFFYRAKVVHAYRKTQNEDFDAAYQHYKKIEKSIPEQIDTQIVKNIEFDNTEFDQIQMSKNLTRLRITLPQISYDSINYLQTLEYNKDTIFYYSRKYEEKLKEIAHIYPQEDLKIFRQFSTDSCLNFKEEITLDLEYLRQSYGNLLDLIDRTIASIRGQVAIKQAELESDRQIKEKESDRSLQVTILAVGSGIGAGTIVASSYSVVEKEEHYPTPFDSNAFKFSVGYSLIFSVIAGVLIWLLIWVLIWIIPSTWKCIKEVTMKSWQKLLSKNTIKSRKTK